MRNILKFLIFILIGLGHLQHLSPSVHTIDQDWSVAKAWQQVSWVDYSGVNRTVSGLNKAEPE